MSDDRFPTQRDVMRAIYKAHGGDKDATINAYAQAERDGKAPRKNNTLEWDADQYAAELWRDGIKKGWLA